jgi:hypothetical protein
MPLFPEIMKFKTFYRQMHNAMGGCLLVRKQV